MKILKLVLSVVVLLEFPALVQAQFTFTTNEYNTITIVGYKGSDSTVAIPSSVNSLPVTTIADGAFDYGVTLTNITIPDTVTNIGMTSFANCVSLTSITVDSGNSFFSSVDGVLFNQNQTLLMQFPKGKSGGYVIPSTVTRIGDYAFYNKNILTSVVIPDSVTLLGKYSFGNSLLNTITIPNSVTNIGDGAFGECIWLTNVTIGHSVTSIGAEAFLDCRNLAGIDIPNSVTDFGSAVFEDCLSITNITIPDSVTNIGNALFFGCYELSNVKLPNNLSNFGSLTFYYCFSLTNLNIPSNTTNIGDMAFFDCISLTSMTIPNSIVSIGYESFAGCANLTNIAIPDSVTSIGDAAFSGCSGLVKITMPDSITNMGSYVFSWGTNLKEVFFTGNVPSYDNPSIFTGDTNATAYYLPGSSGWGTTFSGIPTALWLPQIQTIGASFYSPTNQFGFGLNWASGQTVVVEASTNLINWQPVQTNTLTVGLAYFCDPQWTNYPDRFYRLRSL